jgi:hypothetical protein
MKIPKQIMSKQIRLKCRDCCGNERSEIKFCSATDCSLWYFRFGTYPKTCIKAHGDSSKILFDKDEFKEKGILSHKKTVSELRKEYKRLSFAGEHIRPRHINKRTHPVLPT